MAAGSVTASSSTGSELNDSFRRGTPDPRAGSSRDTLFETMSTRSLLVRLGLVLCAALLAVSVPNFGFVVALMGAFTTMLVSFILPTAFYLAVHRDTLTTA